MATDPFSPTPATTHSTAPHQTAPTTQTTAKSTTTTTARPTGFVRSPAKPLPTLSAAHEPESSSLGRSITIGAIIVLVILLIFQVVSKGRLRSQLNTLEQQNEALTSQTTTQGQPVTQAAPATTAVSGVTPSTTLQLITYPILYREKQYQKIAQTISVTTTAKISGVSLRGTPGEGTAGQVIIYEGALPNGMNTKKDIVKQSFDTSKLTLDPSYLVAFKKNVELKAGTSYTMVIETTNKNTQAQIAYRVMTPSAPGTMWVYSRKLSSTGEVLSQDFVWQEIPGYDLFFELRGAQ